MVLVSSRMNPKACKSFEAKIDLLYHVNKISKGFQATLHIGNVCQTAYISYMDKPSIKTNERAKVIFRFVSRCEYLTVGTKLIFREGTTKGMGEVTKIIPFDSEENIEVIRAENNVYRTKKQKIHSPSEEKKSLKRTTRILSESNNMIDEVSTFIET